MRLKEMIGLFKTDRLSDTLPYMSYDKQRELYCNTDGTMGFVLEMPAVMFAGSNVINGICSTLEHEWPKGALLQFILYADPNIDYIIDNYLRYRIEALSAQDARDRFLLSWTEWQANYLREHCAVGISQDVPVPFRNFRIFITVKVPASPDDVLGKSTKASAQLNILRDSIKGNLRSNHIRAYNVRPDTLNRVLWQLWNPNHKYLSLDANAWDEHRPLRDQIVAFDTEVEPTRKGVIVDRHRVAVKIPQVYPNHVTSSMVNQLVGDMMGSNQQQICCPFLLTLNIDPSPAETNINTKAEVTGMQNAAFKALAPKIHRKNEEFMWAAQLQEQGVRFFRGYITLLLYSTNTVEEEERPENFHRTLHHYESMTTAWWETLNFRLQDELFAALPFMIAAMPFGLYQQSLKNMNRFQTCPSGTFALLAPIQADWRGTQSEAMLFLTRRGQVCSLNFYDSDTNYNFAVAAPSGSGKSFLVNKVLQEHASRGGIVYVVDIGRSYKKQCELQLGQYIEFVEGKNISVNVFGELMAEMFNLSLAEDESVEEGEKTVQKEQRASLLNLFSDLLAVMANPTETITDLERSILSNVIIEAYKRLNDGEIMEIDRFVAILEEKQSDIDAEGKQDHVYGHLAERLKKYCETGEFGKWFRGKMNVDFTRPFVVLELEELNNMKDLREVVLLLLISVIERKFYLGDRKVPKIILFDEAWDLFRNPNTAAFIETAYRRMRKYNGSIGTIVQSFLDFETKGNSMVGQAILSNSEWKLALQPKVESLKECVEKHFLSLSEYELNVAGSIHTSKGRYSEVLLMSSRTSSVFRFLPTPAEIVAFTTDPVQVQVYDNIRTQLLHEGMEEVDPVYILSLVCYAYHLLDEGAHPDVAERRALNEREEALHYSQQHFKKLM